jgi:multiple sugar transport system permease protein
MINKQQASSPVLPMTQGVPMGRRLRAILGQDWSVAWLFMVPTLILLGGVIAYPFLRALYLSFTNTTSVQVGPFIGLENYRYLLRDKVFVSSLVITAKFTLASITVKVIIGTLSAILLNRLGGKAAILVGLVLLPWIMPDVVRAITWKSMLDPLYGGVNYILVHLGIVKAPIAFLGDMRLALPSIVLVNLWQGIPFFTINLLPASNPSTRNCTKRPPSTAPASGGSSCTSHCPVCAMC